MAKEKVDQTLEQIERKREKARARAEARKILREFVDASGDEGVKEAFILLHGTGVRKRGAFSSLNLLRKLFLEKGELSELDIFTQFNMGRPAMTCKIRDLINVLDVDKRVWVTLDQHEGVYKVVGQGEYPPENWRGYIPKVNDAL